MCVCEYVCVCVRARARVCVLVRFGRCVFKDVSYNCTQQEMELGCAPYEKENRAQLRVAIATFCLASTCMAYVFGS